MMALVLSVCKDCNHELTPCPSCNLPRCGCRPATDIHADNVRYVHWLDGKPLQVSVDEHARRLAHKKLLARRGYCGVCGNHQYSQAHQHECAAGMEERRDRMRQLRALGYDVEGARR